MPLDELSEIINFLAFFLRMRPNKEKLYTLGIMFGDAYHLHKALPYLPANIRGSSHKLASLKLLYFSLRKHIRSLGGVIGRSNSLSIKPRSMPKQFKEKIAPENWLHIDT